MAFSRVSFVETSCALRYNNLLNPVEFMVTYLSYSVPYFEKTKQLRHGCGRTLSDEFIEKHLADPRQSEELSDSLESSQTKGLLWEQDRHATFSSC